MNLIEVSVRLSERLLAMITFNTISQLQLKVMNLKQALRDAQGDTSDVFEKRRLKDSENLINTVASNLTYLQQYIQEKEQ
jgi:hypothetical protein